jgi:hypothetical protein
MPIDDPETWKQTASAIKATFESFRSGIGMMRDVKLLVGGSPEQQQAIDKALATAESSANFTEVQILKALGYELCKCQVPPTPMLTVGHRIPPGTDNVEPVYECPRCGFNTAGGFTFTRTSESKNPQE